ncbi:MAG: hypothetical protein JNN27_02980 [Planctomycetes bacterium]|nr:hypothetical protein [Planctomycetota bacterium]
MKRSTLAASIACLLFAARASAQLPLVPGHVVEVYATVTDPVRMAFDSAGVMYVGRDAGGSGGANGAAVKIHRIEIGGGAATEYGLSAIGDPDAVVVDEGGVLGVAGAVLVGGQISDSVGGQISRIAPDQSVSTLLGPTSAFHNPTEFVFDSSGRLLFTNAANNTSPNGVYQIVGGVVSLLAATTPQLSALDLDSTGRIFAGGANGTIRVFSSTGVVLNASFAASNRFAIGSLGAVGEHVYAVDAQNRLQRISMQGVATQIGTGFSAATDLEFGPDGALYVAEFSLDRILRIRPSVSTYCTAGTSTNGCVPSIGASGVPSASASAGFSIDVANLEGQKLGLVFYGVSGRLAAPWGVGSSSFLCVKSPTQRLPIQNSGGTSGACNGSTSRDWLAFVAASPTALGAPFSSGDVVDAQCWYRDPAAVKTTNLSDALEFLLAP